MVRTVVIAFAWIVGSVGFCFAIAVERSEPLGSLAGGLAIATAVLSAMFCTMSESVIEDGVRSAMLGALALGMTLAIPTTVPLSLAFVPGVAAIVASSLNYLLKRYLRLRSDRLHAKTP